MVNDLQKIEKLKREEAQPSYRPLVVAFGVLLIAIGVMVNLFISGAGLALVLLGIAGWVQENRIAARRQEQRDG